MSKAGVEFSEVKELLLKDEEFRAEYDKLKPRYDAISCCDSVYCNRVSMI